MRSFEQLCELVFPYLYWLSPQIPSIQLKQVECDVNGASMGAMPADQIKHGKAILIANACLTVDQA
jgi:hypothetical protein